MTQVFKPRRYQQDAIDFLWAIRKAGLFLDVGMGKTSCTTAVIARSIDEFDTCRWLVVAPKRVCETTWKTEVTKWAHSAGLRVQHLTGLDRAERTKRAHQAGLYDVTVVNIDNLPWLIELYGKSWPWDGVVLDESSKLKDPDTKRFKALRRVMPYVDRLIALTGSPCAQGLLGLWSQMYLIDSGEALGRTFTSYKMTFFDSDYMGYKWTLRDGAEDQILSAIKPVCLTMRAMDFMDLPKVLTNTIEVELPDETAELYKEMERDFLIELGDTPITAANGGVLVGKLQQIANGAIYPTIEDKRSEIAGRLKYTVLHEAKLDALAEFIDEANGTPFLLAYQFRADIDRLCTRFKCIEQFDGSPEQMKRWQNKEIPVLALQPQSGGHGVDGLQYGSCTVVWFSPPWSREQYDQLNGRVSGTRQLSTEFKNQPAHIHHLSAVGTVDELIAATLLDLGATQDRVLNALRNYVKRESTEEIA